MCAVIVYRCACAAELAAGGRQCTPAERPRRCRFRATDRYCASVACETRRSPAPSGPHGFAGPAGRPPRSPGNSRPPCCHHRSPGLTIFSSVDGGRINWPRATVRCARSVGRGQTARSSCTSAAASACSRALRTETVLLRPPPSWTATSKRGSNADGCLGAAARVRRPKAACRSHR